MRLPTRPSISGSWFPWMPRLWSVGFGLAGGACCAVVAQEDYYESNSKKD
jgi:hypothetical protein